jgi:hypothetical protein
MSTRVNRWLKRVRRFFANAPARPIAWRRARLSLEPLENRLVPTVFNVNSLADLSIVGGVDHANGHILGHGNTVTLRSAIEAANATPGGNTINLTVPGTYKITLPGANEDNNLTGDFDILASGGNLTIRNASRGTVTVSGNHLDRVFDINPNFDPATPTKPFTVTLQGMTITNGVASPGDGPNASGGGIRVVGNASLVLNQVVVTNNVATADGGGIVMENIVSVPWTLTLNNSVISNNHAGDAGGGIDADGSGKVLIDPGTVISGNSSVNQGAGIWLDAIQAGTVFQTANLTVVGAVIRNNRALTAGSVGGGIGNAGNGAVTLVNSTVEGNAVNGAGGGFGEENAQGTLTVVDSLFRDNVSSGDGGGVAEGGLRTTIVNSEFLNNSAGGNGGAVLDSGVLLFVQSSTFAGNTAAGNGGGIELQTTGAGLDASTITDATITGNNALNNAGGNNGGGIDAGTAFTGDLVLLNDTINANFATNGGGIFWAGTTGSHVVVENSILAANIGQTGLDANNPAGTFTDRGGNLLGVSGDGNTGFGDATTQTGTLANPLDPMLGPLQNNGGPRIGAPGDWIVLQTEAPETGSPAIGRGILALAPAADERGFQSVVNGLINVGAVSQQHRHHC